jgi:plasmid stabilization system protein ParE
VNGPRANLDREGVERYRSDCTLHRPAQSKRCPRIGLGIYDRAQILIQHPEAGTILDELREGGWRKLIFRRWKIVYTIRGDVIIVGRVWPAAMGKADFETPL